MAGTRRSARQAGNNSSSPASSNPAPASKRKADAGAAKPQAKRGRKAGQKEQTTIEASMPDANENGDSKDVDMKDGSDNAPAETGNGVEEVAKREEEIRDQEDMGKGNDEKEEKPAEGAAPDTNGAPKHESKVDEKNGFDAIMNKDDKDADTAATEEGTGSKVSQSDNAVEESKKREEEVPSSVLEKGLICMCSLLAELTIACNHLSAQYRGSSSSSICNHFCFLTADICYLNRLLFPWPSRDR